MLERFEAGAMAPVMPVGHYSGIHLLVVERINTLVTRYATMTEAILQTADAYSRGDLSTEPPEFPGERQSITVALRQIRNNLRLISEEIAALLHELSEGRLQVRAVPDRYQGTFRALLEDINHLLDATATPFLEARSMIESLARGEINPEAAQVRPGEYGHMDQAIGDIGRKLQQLLYYDRLTELPNRFLLTEILHRAIAKAKRNNFHVALLLCDLDRFKPYNDLHGNQFGDALLRAAAARITQHLRPNDTVARFADDEFAILLEECTGPLQAQQLAQRLVRAMRQPFIIDGIEVRIGISIGVGMAPDDGQLTETILSAAELALSEAKKRGGDQVAFHARTITETLRTRITIEEALRRAIERDEEEQQLTLHFQPVWDGRTKRIVGAEALLRWHQGETIVSPGTFLPIAEQGGLMVALGQFVLHRAFAQLAHWHEQGLGHLYMTINCHSEQFRNGLILQQLELAMARCPVALDKVILELTEESLVDQAAALDTLQALKGRGVRLAVDDFGTGYSSLAYLSQLPVDVLKIDRTFIKDLPGHNRNAAIVRAIIELGSGLELSIVAEGVETEAQRQFLLEERCQLFQGFLLAPALPGDTFLKKVRTP
jgi:diguanylate cyclase (GGDEF)-like protein